MAMLDREVKKIQIKREMLAFLWQTDLHENDRLLEAFWSFAFLQNAKTIKTLSNHHVALQLYYKFL